MNKLKLYRSMAVAAVAVLAAGGLSFVSCDTFDDSAIQESIDDLNSRVESLEAFQASIQGDVDAIKTLLDGGKVIKSITPDEDGTTYTITYVGEDAASDIITVGGGTPVITVIDDNGTHYWGIVNANGEEDYLFGPDHKVQVEDAVPQMQVTDAGELQVSMDKGGTWTGTGVTVEGIVSTFKSVAIGDGEVIFTLQNGTEFSVPMTTVLSCEIVSGKVVFSLGETKEIPVEAGGYENYEIDVPYGWKASLSGSVISVTAPSSEDRETAGELRFRVYAGERVKMDKIRISVGAQLLNISTGVADGEATVTVTTPYEMTFFLGAAKLSEYSADKAAELAGEEMYSVKEDVRQYKQFSEAKENPDGSYTTLPVTKAFSDLVPDAAAGETYVIWAFEFPDNYVLDPEEIQTYIYVYGQNIEVNITDETFHSVNISITPTEGTSYYYGVYPYKEFNRLGEEEARAGVASLINNGLASSTTRPISGDISELGSLRIIPGGRYVLWTALGNHGEGVSYTADDISVYDIQMTPLEHVSDEALAVKFGELTQTSSEVSAPFEIPGNVYETYVDYISLEDYTVKYGSDDSKVVEDILQNVWPFSGEASKTASESGLAPETEGYLVAFVVSNDGKVGPLAKIATETLPLEAAGDYFTGADIVYGNDGAATASGWSGTMEFTGEADAMIYYFEAVSGGSYGGSAEAIKMAMDDNPNSWKWDYGSSNGGRVVIYDDSDKTYLSESVINISGLNPGTEYILVATLVKSTVDGGAEGAGMTTKTLEKYVSFTFTTTAGGRYIASSESEWTDTKPQLSGITYVTNGKMTTASITVTPGADVENWYAYDGDLGVTGEALLQQLKTFGPRSGEGTYKIYLFGSPSKFYLAWTDKEGNSYEPFIMDVPMPAE